MKSIAVDIHAHALIEEVEVAVRAHPQWRREMEQAARLTGEASLQRNRQLMTNEWMPRSTRIETRIAAMDKMGIDVQAVSVVPTQYYYWADRDLAAKLVSAANARIAETCAARPDRLVGLGTVALQHRDLAVAQLEHAVRGLGLKASSCRPR